MKEKFMTLPFHNHVIYVFVSILSKGIINWTVDKLHAALFVSSSLKDLSFLMVSHFSIRQFNIFHGFKVVL
jgi:hypothetical protein